MSVTLKLQRLENLLLVKKILLVQIDLVVIMVSLSISYIFTDLAFC